LARMSLRLEGGEDGGLHSAIEVVKEIVDEAIERMTCGEKTNPSELTLKTIEVELERNDAQTGELSRRTVTIGDVRIDEMRSERCHSHCVVGMSPMSLVIYFPAL
jgi:hypothetical protein